MKKFKVISGVLGIGQGAKIELTAEQAAPRAHNLDKTETEGVYVARVPLQFKTGEVLGLEYEAVAKSQRDQIEEADKPVEQAELEVERKPARTSGRRG